MVRLPLLLVGGDVAAVLLAARLAGQPVELTVVAVLVAVVALGLAGLYRSRLVLSLLDDLPALVTAWLAATAVMLALQSLVGYTTRDDWVLVILVALLLALSRLGTYAAARRLRARGVTTHDSLIIGTTDYGLKMARILTERPEYGLRPAGFLCDRDEDRPGLPLPVLGRVNQLPALIGERNIQVAILAYENVPDNDLVKLVRSCHRLRCELYLIPQFAELHGVNSDTEIVWGLPMVRLRRRAHRTVAWRFKRLIDLTVAGTALAILAPVLAALALAVRLDGGPGVIFRQTRVSIDGREFSLMKFRSLRPADDAESDTHWNISDDQRLGTVGRLLRKSSLDELPQLVNIVRGDMSLVGPRPERPHFVREFSDLYPSYQSRDRVPCGLTGWAQIHGLRGNTPIDQRAEFDNYYIEHWSLWLDTKIILKTITAVFTAPGS